MSRRVKSIKGGKVALTIALVFVFNLSIRPAAQINQMNRIAYFRNVPISIDLQFTKSTLSKGIYDLEIHARAKTPRRITSGSKRRGGRSCT